MHALFRGYLPQQLLADIPRDAASGCAARSTGGTRAKSRRIVEPLVQCAGGMKMHDADVLRTIADAADDAGTLLICDEIAVNFRRAGSLFAIQQANVVPDIICLGKALTGGAINLAATVATADVFDAFCPIDPRRRDARPTYMAILLACAAANASLDLSKLSPASRSRLPSKRRSRDLAPLAGLPGVVDVRVKGAVGAIEVAELHDLDWLKEQFVEAGIWLRPFGNVIYTMPPLTISEGELAAITGRITEILPRWASRHT